MPCPCCSGELCVIGSRKRAWFKGNGDRSKLVIRRLQCQLCSKIHHELPDLLVPYKRYEAQSIEEAVAEPPRNDIAAEQSTLARWRSWFGAWAVYAAGCLQAIALRYDLPAVHASMPDRSAFQLLGRYVGKASGWLSRVVRPLTNQHLWVTDPFCLSVRSLLA